MAEATEIILNPRGNRDRDGRRWLAAQRACLRALAPAEVTLVESAEEAAHAAKAAAMKGYRKIVSVGDAHTAHGVVNGLMELAETHRRELKAGFLSLSRRDPWSRTLQLPRDLERQLEILAAGHTLPYDVGRVDCRQEDGRTATRHFLNGARLGLPGTLARDWRDPDTKLPEALVRMARALSGGRGARVRLETGSELLYEGHCALTLIMEGRYDAMFGRVAPQADPKDGLLDVAWLGEDGWWRAVLKLAGLALGPWHPAPAALRWHRVETLRASALNGPVYVEADGVAAGCLPASFSAVRRALPVMVAPVAIPLRKPRFAPVSHLRGGHLAGNIKSAVGL